jgi:hypothetical protein
MEIPKPSYEELVDSVFRQADKIAKKQWEIEQLRAEIERLRAERDELFKANGEVAGFVASLQREIVWLKKMAAPRGAA